MLRQRHDPLVSTLTDERHTLLVDDPASGEASQKGRTTTSQRSSSSSYFLSMARAASIAAFSDQDAQRAVSGLTLGVEDLREDGVA